jgi:hypothetical protein
MVIALKNMSVLDFCVVSVVVHCQFIPIFVVFNLHLVLILLLSLQVHFAYGQGLISGAYLNTFGRLWCPLTESSSYTKRYTRLGASSHFI